MTAMTVLGTGALAACGDEGSDGPAASSTPTTQEEPAASQPPSTQEATPSADVAGATPEERVEDYFEALDASAADGHEDTSFADEFLVPELAETQKEGHEQLADDGMVRTGERVLSSWTVLEETDTTATVEFCDDTSAFEVTRNGEPVEVTNLGEGVRQFMLVRDSVSEPWLIESNQSYDEGTTCDEHFSG